MWREPIMALLLIGSLGCDSAQQERSGVTSKELTQLAQKAKAEGKPAITIGLTIEPDTGSRLRDVLRKSSIVVVTATGEPGVRVVGDASIITTQDFRVERWLHRIPASASDCFPPWPGVADDDSLVTTRLAKGTVVVDGVQITEMTLAAIDFAKGQRYVLLVNDCAGRRIELAYLFNSVFTVANDGQIVVADKNSLQIPFVKEIVELKTISSLDERLKSLSTASD